MSLTLEEMEGLGGQVNGLLMEGLEIIEKTVLGKGKAHGGGDEFCIRANLVINERN